MIDEKGSGSRNSSQDVLALDILAPSSLQTSAPVEQSQDTVNDGTEESNYDDKYIKEKDKEPTESILAWRAKVESIKSPNAVRRWYLKNGKDQKRGVDAPTEPAVVEHPEWFEVELPMDGLPVGTYEVCFCASLKDAAAVTEELCFTLSLDGYSSTSVRQEEVQHMPNDDFTRFKLHRQVDFGGGESDLSFKIFVTAGDHSGPLFDIHYIEIRNNHSKPIPGVLEYVLYGDGKPDQVVAVGQYGKAFKESVNIRAFGVSDNGSHAATLHFADGLAHVDIWDLHAEGNRASPLHPQVYDVASAHTTFIIPNSVAISTDIKPGQLSINISSSGSQVAVCSDSEVKDGGIPFRVFRSAPAAPADKNLSDPWRLVKAKTVCDNSHYNLISFYREDFNNSDEDAERFWTYDGKSFTVYSISGNWNRLYTLSMQGEANALTAQAVLGSMQGRYFAWTGTKGIISVLDFSTGKLVSRIHPGSDKSSFPCLSLDGSMIAFSLNGAIHVRDTLTDIPIAVYKERFETLTDHELVFGKDHFLTFNSEIAISNTLDTRSVVQVSDGSVIKSYYVHEDYHYLYPQSGHDAFFAYAHGSNLDILKPGPIFSSAALHDGGLDGACSLNVYELLTLGLESTHELVNATGTKFTVYTTYRSRSLKEESSMLIYVTVYGESDDDKQVMEIYMGRSPHDYFAFFLPETSQLGLVTDDYFQLWTLAAEKPRVCELVMYLKYQRFPEVDPDIVTCERAISAVKACKHGKNFNLRLSEPFFYKNDGSFIEILETQHEDTLTIPATSEDTLGTSDIYRLTGGYIGLIDFYSSAGESAKRAIVRYLKSRIRVTQQNPVSSLITLCSNWTQDRSSTLEAMIADMLPIDLITWAPDANTTKESDVLTIILEKAKFHSSTLPVVRIIMDYCVHHAYRSHNLAFISPFFSNLRDFMEIYPDEAKELLGRIAFVPVGHRSNILNNHAIIHSPGFRLQFWKPSIKTLSESTDPILQFRVSSGPLDPSTNRFTLPLFLASFDALWSYRDDKMPIRSNSDAMAEASNKTTTAWWKILLHMLRLKSHLRMDAYVECYNFDLEFFDNPAIAALVAYKWNTIGFWYWFVRFFFQCCFYALVAIASILQVYYPEPSKLVGLFIAIIVMSAGFVWLELLQAIRSVARYANSGYNVLDMVAFLLPMAASIDQVIVIYQKDSHGNNRLLSYSVLAVFLHMLFELRINKMVCKYVTIIQEAVSEIKVFFFIFAGGILAFAIAVLHLLRSCPYEGCDEPTTDFSDNFLGALFQTYFFLGGRWDPVSDEFATKEWGFQLMMALFFFFTIILMLNVLIALVNVAFVKGDDSWRLIWIESRLRYIESAENMSYHIPGFRQTYDLFPKEIYFTAGPKQVKEFRKTHPANGKSDEEADRTEELMCQSASELVYVHENNMSKENDEEGMLNYAGPVLTPTNMAMFLDIDNDTADVGEEGVEGVEGVEGDNGEVEDGTAPSVGSGIAEVVEGNEDNSGSGTAGIVEVAEGNEDKSGSSTAGQDGIASEPESEAIKALSAQVGALKTQLAEQQQQAQRQFEELRNLLLVRQTA
ncbi:hypothetical protein BGZ99_000207 [Dissophora globulifera]|uniref:Ion transport domain-containing protein n=1 Tax=Dissophora globulifera TaxID=979702 RepID=A0A9P6RRM6_9FUNG|nr:hypothetical protein BGZ99_000207 [Dissophora globulifera]